jgi:hypothetical protein
MNLGSLYYTAGRAIGELRDPIIFLPGRRPLPSLRPHPLPPPAAGPPHPPPSRNLLSLELVTATIPKQLLNHNLDNGCRRLHRR